MSKAASSGSNVCVTGVEPSGPQHGNYIPHKYHLASRQTLSGLFLILAGVEACGAGNSPVSSQSPDDLPSEVQTTFSPGDKDTLFLADGAWLAVGEGSFPVETRILFSGEGGTVERGLGEGIRLSMDPILGASSQLRPASVGAGIVTLCVPSSLLDLGSADVRVEVGGIYYYAWATETADGCIKVDLPTGDYEGEFFAMLVDRQRGEQCQEFRLISDTERNNAQKKKALILIHGWQSDKPTCADYVGWEPTEEYWNEFLNGVVACSTCASIEQTFNIYYYKYPSLIVSPDLAASHLRSELNRIAVEDPSLDSETDLVLLGFSMGGLVGRRFLAGNQFSEVEKLITLGTPHLGTYRGLAGGSGFLNGALEHALEAALFPLDFPLLPIFPDGEGTRSLAFGSGFLTQLNDMDVGNRLSIYTLAGEVGKNHVYSNASLIVSETLIKILRTSNILRLLGAVTDAELAAFSAEHDGVVPRSSGLLGGSIQVGSWEGYDHFQMRMGKIGVNDDLWVIVRLLLNSLGTTAFVAGRLENDRLSASGWPVYLVAQPDTVYTIDDIIIDATSETETDPAGTFSFSGVDRALKHAIIGRNPSERGDEVNTIHIDNLVLSEGERRNLNTVNVYQRHRAFTESVYSLNQPVSLEWYPYEFFHNPEESYEVHLFYRMGGEWRLCWESETVEVSRLGITPGQIFCNTKELMGQKPGAGQYAWYAISLVGGEWSPTGVVPRILAYTHSFYFRTSGLGNNLALGAEMIEAPVPRLPSVSE